MISLLIVYAAEVEHAARLDRASRAARLAAVAPDAAPAAWRSWGGSLWRRLSLQSIASQPGATTIRESATIRVFDRVGAKTDGQAPQETSPAA